jgi:cardiolipin hydrolase
MQTLLEGLELSIADALLTTAEKHALAADLRARPLRIDQLRQVRNHAFELVLARAREPSQAAAMPALVKWLNDVVKVIDQAATPVPIKTEVWFSPGEECRTALIGHLQSCRQRVDICVFTIADDRITEAILAAHSRGVVVRVISDDDKRLDSGSDVESLRAAGVAVVLDDSEAHMHHKFAIFDGRWLLNGSFNWTRSASRINEENLVVTNDPQQVREFGTQFELLWARFS